MPSIVSKFLKIFLLFFCLGSFLLLMFFFHFWLEWKKKSPYYVKETQQYFNSLVKFSSQFDKYEEKHNSSSFSYTLYPIKVLDRQGNLIGNIRTNNKIIVSLDKIGENFIHALISTEDQNFYEHNGVSFLGIIRAFFNNLSQMKISEGGSTLTQQLAKLLFTNQEKTISRKINEFFTALNIEKNYTKNDILFMYCNSIYFGYNIYGVGLASRAYFGKNIKDLNVAEAALLVALISNPSFYNPYKHTDNMKKKHLAVLIHMYEEGYLSKSEVIQLYRQFWAHPTLLSHISIPSQIFSGDKELYVLEEVRRFLARSFGSNYLDKLQGATVYTTIDSSIQNHIDENILEHVKKIREESSLSPEEASSIESASILSDVKTGQILAFSGGTQYTENNQFNRAFQAKRQVGSTIKPFLYAVGMDLHKITPYTVFEDTPIQVQFQNKITWDVNNYGKSYRGYLNISEALKRSSNVVAVQATNVIGLENLRYFFEQALDLSPSEASEIFENYKYSIALGAVNLTPYQLNQLYQIIANDGVKQDLYFISHVDDLSGDTLYKNKEHSQILFSRESAYLVKKMLTTVLSPGGSGNYVRRHFNFESEVAGKSGTTQTNRDVWFSGFTNRIAVTTWVGQDNNKSMGDNFVGGIQSGEIFGDFMQYSDHIYPASKFSYQNGENLVKCQVDLLTGYLPTPASLFIVDGLFIKGTEPTKPLFLGIQQQLKIAREKKILTPEKIKEISQNRGFKEEVSSENQNNSLPNSDIDFTPDRLE